MQQQLSVFGMHTARLDLRQHSSHHEAAVAEVLDRDDYPGLREAEKCAVLAEALAGKTAMPKVAIRRFSTATRNVLEPLRLSALEASKFGRDARGQPDQGGGSGNAQRRRADDQREQRGLKNTG